MIKELKKDLLSLANKEKAKALSRFFKTGKGEYGFGDKFHGIMVPQSREIVKKYYKQLDFVHIDTLLKSEYHEERFIGVMILVEKFKKGELQLRKKIFEYYLENAPRINNWDLVDLSAPNIVGSFLFETGLNKLDSYKSKKSTQLRPVSNTDILYKLTQSSNLWERRIAVLATFTFIRNKQFEDSLKICKILLNDKHDLMHKACGWMLREIGKRDEKVLEKFLEENILQMPRTMLRYSIEKFNEEKRKSYLNYGK